MSNERFEREVLGLLREQNALLRELVERAPPRGEWKSLLPLEEAAAWLGVSGRSMKEWIERGQMRAFILSGRTRILRRDLEAIAHDGPSRAGTFRRRNVWPNGTPVETEKGTSDTYVYSRKRKAPGTSVNTTKADPRLRRKAQGNRKRGRSR